MWPLDLYFDLRIKCLLLVYLQILQNVSLCVPHFWHHTSPSRCNLTSQHCYFSSNITVKKKKKERNWRLPCPLHLVLTSIQEVRFLRRLISPWLSKEKKINVSGLSGWTSAKWNLSWRGENLTFSNDVDWATVCWFSPFSICVVSYGVSSSFRISSYGICYMFSLHLNSCVVLYKVNRVAGPWGQLLKSF